MIPPLQAIRLRSIVRYHQDRREKEEGERPQPEELKELALEKDDAMLQEFEEQDASLMERLMREDKWGREAGLQEYKLRRMEIWQEVVSDFLPMTFDQSAED